MKLTKQQNEELDSLKQRIESIEKKIESAQISIELGNEEDQRKFSKIVNYGGDEIGRMVRIQSEAMKMEFNLVMDLIFDREYTLTLI